MLNRADEGQLEWLYSQTVFERSTAGGMLHRARLYWQTDAGRGGGDRDREDDERNYGLRRNEYPTEAIHNAAGGIIGRRTMDNGPVPKPETSQGHQPREEDMDRLGELWDRQDVLMRQEGGAQLELALRTYYGAPGAFFLQADLPRLWSLLHLVHEGQQFMRRMEVLLADEREKQQRAIPAVAARLKAGTITVAQLREMPELDGPSYARMRTCCLVRKREKYRPLLPMFEVAGQKGLERLKRACFAWEATAT